MLHSLLSYGSTGDDVKKIQAALNLKEDGIFGRITEAAVKNFQRKNGLFPDGKVSAEMMTLLFGDDITTDCAEHYHNSATLNVHQYPLPPGEFVEEKFLDKKYIFLHHTAGWDNPYNQVDGWARDNRGRVGTHYVIGGRNHRTGDFSYDGVVVQCISSQHWAYHLGTVPKVLHQKSIGIEICSFGQLQYINGKYKTYIGTPVEVSQVYTLDKPFKGSKHYHKYSDKQLESLEKLLKKVGEEFEIDLKKGLQEWIKEFGPHLAFDYFTDAYYGKVPGLLSHTNVKKSKNDVYPDSRLVDLIMSL